MSMKQQITDLLKEVLRKMGVTGVVADVDRPENALHGDYTTNVAMRLAGRVKGKGQRAKSPMEIANEIKKAIIKYQTVSKIAWLERVEVVPPGFINLFLSEASLVSTLSGVLKEKDRFGSAPSANSLPTKDRIDTVGDEAPKGAKKPVQKQGNSDTKNPQKTPLKYRTKSATAILGRPNGKQTSPVQGRRVMVEFAHPNTHKAFHIGHVRNITTGESIVRLLESQGNHVIRGNYQGDVGMHIAKVLYALLELSPYKDQVKGIKGIHARVEFLGKAYAAGSKAFEEDKEAQAFIKDLNALIYASAQKYAREVGRNPGTTDYLALVKNHRYPLETVYTLWKETRQWSLDYFETIYARLLTHYDRLFFESECLSGVDRAKEAVKQGVLKESEGAIIFDGKPFGIDTRVFVNNLGLPTYEGKELALAAMETTEFGQLDRIIHVVGPEQSSFFKITFKVEELLSMIRPGMQHHLVYGWVKLKHGKMSSRSGNVVLGEWLLDEAKKEVGKILDQSIKKYTKAQQEEIAEKAAVAAAKYAFLKVSTKNEIAFDFAESVNINGDSGPYLQYTYARCRSVLRKAPNLNHESGIMNHGKNGKIHDSLFSIHHSAPLNPEERALARRISYFPDVVAEAAKNYAPNTLCTYLFQLAQEFNLFYAKHTILGGAEKPSAISHPLEAQGKQPSANQKAESRKPALPAGGLTAESSLRLALTAATAQVLKNGLYLLGIEVLEQM